MDNTESKMTKSKKHNESLSKLEEILNLFKSVNENPLFKPVALTFITMCIVIATVSAGPLAPLAYYFLDRMPVNEEKQSILSILAKDMGKNLSSYDSFTGRFSFLNETLTGALIKMAMKNKAMIPIMIIPAIVAVIVESVDYLAVKSGLNKGIQKIG